MDDRMLREMNSLSHHAALLRGLEPARDVAWPRWAGPSAARPDRRLALWLGGRLVRLGADLARHGRPAPARRTA